MEQPSDIKTQSAAGSPTPVIKMMVFGVLYLLAGLLAAIVLHELSHFIAALLLGIPLSEIHLVFRNLNPGVVLTQWSGPEMLSVFSFSGGLGSGAVILIVYFGFWVRRFYRTRTIGSWYFGLITLIIAGIEISSGILEGQDYHTYFYGGGIGNPLNWMMLIAMVAAIGLHLLICRWNKIGTAAVNNTGAPVK